MQSTDERILTALASGPLALFDVAEQVQRSPSATLRRLQFLASSGHIERLGDRKEARYRLRPRLAIEWAHGEGTPPRWIRASWQATEAPADWRFPLASRLQDENGRAALTQFLRALWLQGLTTPWLREATGSGKTNKKSRKSAGNDAAPDPNPDAVGFDVIAFGSCVDGNTRDDSDLDLILFESVDSKSSLHEQFQSIADSVNLTAPRYIDLHVVARADFDNEHSPFPTELRNSILRDGVTVYSCKDHPAFIELERAPHSARAGDEGGA